MSQGRRVCYTYRRVIGGEKLGPVAGDAMPCHAPVLMVGLDEGIGGSKALLAAASDSYSAVD